MIVPITDVSIRASSVYDEVVWDIWHHVHLNIREESEQMGMGYTYIIEERVMRIVSGVIYD